jgi:hypothetical protein
LDWVYFGQNLHSNFFLPEVRDSAPPNFGLSFGTIWLNPKFGTLISGFALRSVPEFRYILPVMLKKITEFSGSFSMFWDRLPEAYHSKNYRTSIIFHFFQKILIPKFRKMLRTSWKFPDILWKFQLRSVSVSQTRNLYLLCIF